MKLFLFFLLDRLGRGLHDNEPGGESQALRCWTQRIWGWWIFSVGISTTHSVLDSAYIRWAVIRTIILPMVTGNT